MEREMEGKECICLTAEGGVNTQMREGNPIPLLLPFPLFASLILFTFKYSETMYSFVLELSREHAGRGKELRTYQCGLYS